MHQEDGELMGKKLMNLILLIVVCMGFTEMRTAESQALQPVVILEVPLDADCIDDSLIGLKVSEGDFEQLPDEMTVDSGGNIYILDRTKNRIRKYDRTGTHLEDVFLTRVTEYVPRHSGGNEYSNDLCILKSGEFVPESYETFEEIRSFALDAYENIYIDTINKAKGHGSIIRFTPSGQYIDSYNPPDDRVWTTFAPFQLDANEELELIFKDDNIYAFLILELEDIVISEDRKSLSIYKNDHLLDRVSLKYQKRTGAYIGIDSNNFITYSMLLGGKIIDNRRRQLLYYIRKYNYVTKQVLQLDLSPAVNPYYEYYYDDKVDGEGNYYQLHLLSDPHGEPFNKKLRIVKWSAQMFTEVH